MTRCVGAQFIFWPRRRSFIPIFHKHQNPLTFLYVDDHHHVLVRAFLPTFSPSGSFFSSSNHRCLTIPPPSPYYPISPNDSHFQPPQRLETSQRKRPKYTRSKTGCLTCRIKKIKVCCYWLSCSCNALSCVSFENIVRWDKTQLHALYAWFKRSSYRHCLS